MDYFRLLFSFQGVHGGSYLGDMAIDDVLVTPNGQCEIPSTTTTSSSTTTLHTGPSTTTTPYTGPSTTTTPYTGPSTTTTAPAGTLSF